MKLFVQFIIAPLFTFIALAIFGIAGIYLYYSPQLPSREELRDIALQVPLRIYTDDNELIAEFGNKRRKPLEASEIPDLMKEAFIAAEDNRFYHHNGVDFKGVARAVFNLVSTGDKTQGASTITMQLARNGYEQIGREKTYERKLKETLLALKIEKNLSKEEILTLYLNKIYLGNRSYGVGAASQIYYGKPAEELSIAQTAMIAGLPKAPSRYNPIINPKRAKIRRDYVLNRMLALDMITKQEFKLALAEELSAEIHKTDVKSSAPYFAEMVRAKIVEMYKDNAYTEGFNVYTTLDAVEQERVTKALRTQLLGYDRRHGYRQPTEKVSLEDFPTEADRLKELEKYSIIGDLLPALVLDSNKKEATLLTQNHGEILITLDQVKWARKHISEDRRGRRPRTVNEVIKPGQIVRLRQLTKTNKQGETSTSWQFSQIPAVSGAMVSLDPKNGAILGIAGGFDFQLSKFNRATQAKRQPGSSFKPFVYAAAIDKGYSPASIINDAPIHIPGSKWRPENYSGKFYGPTRLRMALAKSRNLVSIRLLRKIGIPYAIDYATKFGFEKDTLPPNLTLALGTGSTTPLEMAEAYATFANGGYKVNAHFITRITDKHGSDYLVPTYATVCSDDCNPETEIAAERVMEPKTHYQIVSMMQGVTQFGTAARAGRTLKRKDIAGKTGTTNDQRDGWFCGVSPKRVAIAWMGFDDLNPLGKGETATNVALPMWIDYMKVALKDIPEKVWSPPSHLKTMRIDAKTGRIADANSTNVIVELLDKEQLPDEPDDDFAYGDTGGGFSNYVLDTLYRENEAGSIQQNANTGGNLPGQQPIVAPKPEVVEIPEQLF